MVAHDTGSRVIAVGDSVFKNKSYLGSFLAPDLLSIGNSAFSQSSVTNVVVSTNLVSIGSSAFYKVTQLAGFWPRTLPKLETLSDNAFHYTIALGGGFLPEADKCRRVRLRRHRKRWGGSQNHLRAGDELHHDWQ